MKVIIIGAGIAGLTFANACHKQGYEVTIYEKAKQLKNIGGGLLLWPHGLRYLDWLGLKNILAPYYVNITHCGMKDPHGDPVTTLEFADIYEQLSGEILPIDRTQLQQSLKSQLPENILHMGKEIIKVNQTESYAEVSFADGSSDYADLVIGADGIHSITRKMQYPDSEPVPTDYVWWGGIINRADVPELAPDGALFSLTSGKVMIVWPIANNQYLWYLPIKMSHDEFKKMDKSKLLEQYCTEWSNPIIHDIINASSNQKQFHLPISVLDKPYFGHGRIALMGDAAHAMGPITAQGTSLAIEDAFVLFHCLKNYESNISEVLLKYLQLRKVTCEQITAIENQSASMMLDTDEKSLNILLNQLKEVDLVTMYAELIPLVNKDTCQKLAETLDVDVQQFHLTEVEKIRGQVLT